MGLKEHYSMKKPCDDCPFTREGAKKGNLTGNQIREMIRDPEGHICPKTMRLLDGSASMTHMDEERECAGYIIWHLARQTDPFPSAMAMAANLALVKYDEFMEHIDEVHTNIRHLTQAHHERSE